MESVFTSILILLADQTLPIESVSTISDSKSNIKDMYQANQIHPTNIDYLEATAIFDELTPDQRQQVLTRHFLKLFGTHKSFLSAAKRERPALSGNE